MSEPVSLPITNWIRLEDQLPDRDLLVYVLRVWVPSIAGHDGTPRAEIRIGKRVSDQPRFVSRHVSANCVWANANSNAGTYSDQTVHSWAYIALPHMPPEFVEYSVNEFNKLYGAQT